MSTMLETLKKKNRQTLEAERKDLQDRQAFLRVSRDELKDSRKKLRETYYAACKANDSTTKEVLEKELKDIKEDIAEIDKEYQTNSTSLELYSKVLKNRKEGNGLLLGTLFTGLGTAAAIILGKKSLDLAYETDTTGGLVNKKVIEVFKNLNPLAMIQKKR